jgi:hypothetical protein
MRTFGEAGSGLRYYVEASSAGRVRPTGDAFAGAYWYGNGVRLTEAYLERPLASSRLVAGVRVGRYRTPFGISGRGDHAYNGFLRPPLVRYGYYQGPSNYWLEGGVNAYVGIPRLQLEASLGAPQEDLEARRGGPSLALRVQGHSGPFVAGISYLRTHPYPSRAFVRGTGEYRGVDVRWLRDGVQLRAEWIDGRNFERARSSGWYVDATLHRRALGAVMPVARYDEYRYTRSGYHSKHKRVSVGARLRLTDSLTANVNLVNEPDLTERSNNAIDVGITHSMRF